MLITFSDDANTELVFTPNEHECELLSSSAMDNSPVENILIKPVGDKALAINNYKIFQSNETNEFIELRNLEHEVNG